MSADSIVAVVIAGLGVVAFVVVVLRDIFVGRGAYREDE